MNLELNEEQMMLQKSVREFAESEVRPLAKELDETGRFPRELFAKAAELGLTGVAFSEAEGGAGEEAACDKRTFPRGAQAFDCIIQLRGSGTRIVPRRCGPRCAKVMGEKGADERGVLLIELRGSGERIIARRRGRRYAKGTGEIGAAKGQVIEGGKYNIFHLH